MGTLSRATCPTCSDIVLLDSPDRPNAVKRCGNPLARDSQMCCECEEGCLLWNPLVHSVRAVGTVLVLRLPTITTPTALNRLESRQTPWADGTAASRSR